MKQLDNSHWLVFPNSISEQGLSHLRQTNKPNYFSFQKSVIFKKYASYLAVQCPVYLINTKEPVNLALNPLPVIRNTLTIHLCSPPGKCSYYHFVQWKKKMLCFCCLGGTITFMIQALSEHSKMALSDFLKRIINTDSHSTPSHSLFLHWARKCLIQL